MFEDLSIKDLTWTREPILWLGAVVAALNVVYGNLSGDTISLGELWESLALLAAAFVGRGRVTPG